MSAQGHPARWWRVENAAAKTVRCELCPHGCLLSTGQVGLCHSRKNVGGELLSYTYGHPRGLAVDPIEKKPLYHFLPGTGVLSFGTTGCTLACSFCQNWHLSQCRPSESNDWASDETCSVAPHEIVALVRRENVPSLAYTYNEPTVFAEYLVETAALARKEGLRNVMVSNGYITAVAREAVMASIDAINVDLKAFDEEFYRTHTGSSLAPVMDTLRWVARQDAIWLEITTLVIPGLNDDDDQMRKECAWIVGELGPDVPLHLSAFHPAHKMKDRSRTAASSLLRARDIARREGLQYVYVGNVPGDEGLHTLCPGCGALLIERTHFKRTLVRMDAGACSACGRRIPGVFEA